MGIRSSRGFQKNTSRTTWYACLKMNSLDLGYVNRLAPYKKFAAVIVQRSNPRLNGILDDFDETVALL